MVETPLWQRAEFGGGRGWRLSSGDGSEKTFHCRNLRNPVFIMTLSFWRTKRRF
jgi:hypothetical protein